MLFRSYSLGLLGSSGEPARDSTVTTTEATLKNELEGMLGPIRRRLAMLTHAPRADISQVQAERMKNNLNQLQSFLLQNADNEGIFRVPGSVSSVTDVVGKTSEERLSADSLHGASVHDVAGAYKQLLRTENEQGKFFTDTEFATLVDQLTEPGATPDKSVS